MTPVLLDPPELRRSQHRACRWRWQLAQQAGPQRGVQAAASGTLCVGMRGAQEGSWVPTFEVVYDGQGRKTEGDLHVCTSLIAGLLRFSTYTTLLLYVSSISASAHHCSSTWSLIHSTSLSFSPNFPSMECQTEAPHYDPASLHN